MLLTCFSQLAHVYICKSFIQYSLCSVNNDDRAECHFEWCDQSHSKNQCSIKFNKKTLFLIMLFLKIHFYCPKHPFYSHLRCQFQILNSFKITRAVKGILILILNFNPGLFKEKIYLRFSTQNKSDTWNAEKQLIEKLWMKLCQHLRVMMVS